MNLRALMHQNEIVILSHSFFIGRLHIEYSSNDFGFLVLFNFLKAFYSTHKVLRNKLKHLCDSLNGINTHPSYHYQDQKASEQSIINLCLPFVIEKDEEILFQEQHDYNKNYTYYFSNLNITFHYRYESGARSIPIPFLFRITEGESIDLERSNFNINVNQLLLYTYDLCLKKGYLQ